MITGVHAMFYSPQAEELRLFFRDQLGLENFDAGEGWLIFTPSFGEIGCHPSEETSHEISLCCEDVDETVATLAARGVRITGPVEDWGYGRGTHIEAPGGMTIQLYEPSYRPSE